MSLRPTTRCREYRQGSTGRWHTYTCRKCGQKFSEFLARAYPEDAKYCRECQLDPAVRARVDGALIERFEKEQAGEL